MVKSTASPCWSRPYRYISLISKSASLFNRKRLSASGIMSGSCGIPEPPPPPQPSARTATREIARMFLIIFIVPLVTRYVRPEPKTGLSPNNSRIPGGFLPVPTLRESSLWKFHLFEQHSVPVPPVVSPRRTNGQPGQERKPARRRPMRRSIALEAHPEAHPPGVFRIVRTQAAHRHLSAYREAALAVDAAQPEQEPGLC